MNNRLINTLLFAASSTLLLASCGQDNTSFETPNTSGTATNSGVISQKNFSLLTADINPAVIDATTGTFTKTDVELTVYIGDRNNQTLTDAHTINFEAEYGLIEPSCVTKKGSCSVTWSAIKRPDAGGPGSDGIVSITAYTSGEEAFTDTNGNGAFDDADAGFEDLEEPFIDANEDGVYTLGDGIIDVVSVNDPNGVNNIHDAGDGFFNGGGCTHTSLCSGAAGITIFDGIRMNLVTNVPLERTVGGSVANLAGTGLVLQNNGGDNLSITADGAYTFATTITDGGTYAATVLTQPTAPGQVCTIANAAGGPVSANVTNVDVTCVTNTYTIGGGITGLSGTGLVLQNNGGDNLTVLNTDTTYTFATPIDDNTAYDVTVFAQPTGPNEICNIANASAPSTSADVIDANVSCGPAYTIGGAISATSIPATETLVIQNNLGDDYTINSGDTSYVFATPIADGATYNVTVLAFPTSRSSCTFLNNNTTVAGVDVTNVDIDCVP